MKKFLILTAFMICIMAAHPQAAVDSELNGKVIDWFRNGIGYEIFFSSFYDSDGNGIGDIKGVIEKLDYLNDGQPGGNDLGVDFIWFTPIFSSPTQHGYDIIDYYTINKRYGTLDDFRLLVKEANKRGIRIILDLVLNHCSEKHPFFIEAKNDKNSPKRKWFTFSDRDHKWRTWQDMTFTKIGENDYYWSTFGRSVPDWNAANPEVKKYLFDIAEFWLKEGASGFRLDAIRHLIEEQNGETAVTTNTESTLRWLNEFRKKVSSVRPEAVIIGEVWDTPENVAMYSDPVKGNITGGFNFTAEMALANIYKTSAEAYGRTLERTKSLLTKNGVDVIFTGNHDMMRLANSFTSDEERKAAARVFLLTPGTPFIYYGDELGIEAKAKGDVQYRTIMSWSPEPNAGYTTGTAKGIMSKDWEKRNVAAQIKDKKSIFNTYREMILLKKSIPEYGLGRYVYSHSNGNILNFFVKTPNHRYFVAINIAKSTEKLSLAGGEWVTALGLTKDSGITLKEFGNVKKPLEINFVPTSEGKIITSLKGYQVKIFEVR